MADSVERLHQLPFLTSAVVKYGLAYDACHDTVEAPLAAYCWHRAVGLRPRLQAKP